MSEILIEFIDGDRKGDTLTLKNTWDAPERVRVSNSTGTGFLWYRRSGSKSIDGKKKTIPTYREDNGNNS